jgi:hypothetical protein
MRKMFLSLEETKARLQKSEVELKEFIRQGKLRDFRDGSRLVFKADQVEDLAQELQVSEIPTPAPTSAPTIPHVESTDSAGRLLSGMAEDKVRFLIHEFLEVRGSMASLSTSSGEILLGVLKGNSFADLNADEVHWVKAATAVLNRLPRFVSDNITAQVIEAEKTGLGSSKDVVEIPEQAANMIAAAWREKRDLTRDELPTVIRSVKMVMGVIGLEFLVRVTREEWTKFIFNPDRDPNNILSQMMESLSDPKMVQRAMETVQLESRKLELAEILQTLNRSATIA